MHFVVYLDILLYDYYKYDNVKNRGYDICSFPYSLKKKFGNLEILDRALLDQFSFQIGLAAPWCKIYRKEFITQNKLKFQNLTSSNDLYFGRIAMAVAKRVGYLNKFLVAYRCNSEYQISSNIYDNALNAMLGCIEVKRKLIVCGQFINNRASLYTYTLKTILMHLERTDQANLIIQYNEIRKLCIEFFDAPCGVQGSRFLCNYYEKQYEDFLAINADIKKIRLVADIYNYAINAEKCKVEKILLFAKENNLKIAIWGYGKRGKVFVNAWKQNKNVIDFIIDKHINAVNVIKPADMSKNNLFIISTVSNLCDQILEDAIEITEEGYVFDAQAYYEYGMIFEECIQRVNTRKLEL